MAKDERFVACTVKRMYESFMGRHAVLADEGQLAAHREVFLSSGLSIKELAKSLLADPAYRGVGELSSFGGMPDPVLRKLASPDLLTSSILDLTGYKLHAFNGDATRYDLFVRALAGGSDRGASESPSMGHALVQRRNRTRRSRIHHRGL